MLQLLEGTCVSGCVNGLISMHESLLMINLAEINLSPRRKPSFSLC